MKKQLLILFLAAQCAVLSVGAQEKLNVQTFYLDNGLKVIMAEEHSAPKIFGAVIVHAGSKNEDTSATGVAHYFEHIMFKGTDRIGTTDWAQEKIYLDSISMMYDQLRLTRDEEGRKAVQKEINRLNIEASKYAIANETDAILQQMGCTGLNAGTSYDYTVYYNTLPSNQLENWMDVYAERFRNPVFRLFQSELEAVYEERNLYANNIMYDFIRKLFTESFGDHPYSREVIGLDDHLKNPQPSQMKVFYDKYYVASNMTLLLVGDFNMAEAMQMVRERFGIWKKGEKQPKVVHELPKFESQVIKEVKLTPIKAGLMVFPGVTVNHPDHLSLGILSDILSGGNGRMDVLVTEGKLMSANLIPLSLEDAGSNVILYVPKVVGQKHEEAEALVWACIDSAQNGCFSDALLESIKMRHLRRRLVQMESIGAIAGLLENLECEGSSYEEWERDNERLQNITREEIMRVAKLYFDRNRCTIVRSSMGIPKKQAAVKPDWDHLELQNQGAKSPFAQMIADRPVKEIAPQVIDFDRDVTITPLSPNCSLYSAPNRMNNIFQLTLKYHYGLLDDKRMEIATDYLDELGCDSLTLQELNIALERLGGYFSIGSGDDYTFLSISGFEENLEPILDLVMRKLNHPRHDAQQLKNFVEEMEASRKTAKKDDDTWEDALSEYVCYGERSNYLEHVTIKEMKKITGEELVEALQPMWNRDGYATFVGNTPPEHLRQLLLDRGLVRQEVQRVPERERPHVVYGENRLFYASNKSFVKSDISFSAECDRDFSTEDCPAAYLFNEYFGGGMNGIVFQEIREFRSLGYSTYGNFSFDMLNRYKPSLDCYLGTQCDKTNEGIDAMLELMRHFPERPEKFATAKDHLIAARNSNYIGFRSLPSQVRYWREVLHYEKDPRIATTDSIRSLTYDGLRAFHAKYIEGRPVVITISGNAKKIDLKALNSLGTVKKLKYKDFIRF